MTTHPPPPLLPPGGGKVRLVRCPKCRGLLPELPNVPLYKCGGCGATLEAKIRKQPPPATSIPDDQRNELDNSSSSSPCQATKLICTSRDDVNLCLKRPISHQLQSRQGCSPESQLDCRGRKQGSGEAQVDNNGYSSRDAQFVSQGYSAHSATHRPTSDVVLSETRREEVSPDILLGDSDRPSSQSDSDKMETRQVTDEERPSQEDMHIPSSTEFSNNHENELPEEEEEEEEEEEKLGGRSLHAYDGSVSSSEGWDDQVHRQAIQKYTFEFDDTSGEQTRTDVSVNSETNAKVQLPLHPRRFQAMTLNDNLIKTKMGNNINLSQKPPADIRNGTAAQEQLHSESFYTAQTSMQSQRMSEKDLYIKGSPTAYENGGPSTSYSNNEFMYNSDSHPGEKAPSVEHGQDELLRKVDELRDQLCRSYAHKLETRDDERQMCSNQALRRQKDPNCYRRNDPWHLSGAHPPNNSVSFQGQDSSQIPMATNCRYHVDRTSLQCCPEQFQYPLQRQPIAKGCYSEQIYLTHPGYVCYHPCGSGPVIPSQFRNSNFAPRISNSQPLAHGQKQLDHKVERQSLYPHRDRRNHIKRHCLPIAGGAPIIICYSCKKLLHLPADFILTSNRCSRLRCSSCSEILIFRLQSGKSVPLRPNPLTIPPPSEVDSCSNSTGTSSLDFFVPRENRNRDESGETSRVNSRRILLEKRLDGKEVRCSLHGLMGYSSPRRLIQGSDVSLEW